MLGKCSTTKPSLQPLLPFWNCCISCITNSEYNSLIKFVIFQVCSHTLLWFLFCCFVPVLYDHLPHQQPSSFHRSFHKTMTVVIKPAEQTPLSALYMGALIKEVGINGLQGLLPLPYVEPVKQSTASLKGDTRTPFFRFVFPRLAFHPGSSTFCQGMGQQQGQQ